MDGLTLAELFEFTGLNAQNEFSLRTVCALLERRKTVENYGAQAAASHEGQPIPPSSSAEEWFLRFATILRPSLRSPFGSVRLRSLQLLFQLWPFGGRATNSGSESLENAKMLANPIGMLIEAEQCEVSFHSYRQRAQFFRRLKRNNLLALLPSEDEAFRELMEKLVLDVLLAQLYERLTLYWPLLTESIESYAQSLDLFWDCFGFALDFAWDALSVEQNGRNEDEVDKTVGCNTTVNFGSFRVQLLRLLGKLPSARPELRTRYLSPKLITLYRDEFMQFDEPFPTTSSKPVKGEMNSEAQQLCEENGGEERQNDFVDTDDDNLEPPKKDYCPKIGKESAAVKPLRFRVGRRNAVQAIKALLAVYGRFSNPRGVFREKEIHEIYYELLLVNEAEVQRAALGCLLTYKYAWLTPYKTHLEALLDPRQLRDHLVLFVVDNRRDADDLLDEHSLTDQHRPDLIPVLIRLLYGSLHTHVATRGKTKRLAIFRFLANCHSNELGLFLQLIFGPLFSFFETNDENDATSGLERTFSSLDSKMDIVRSMSLNKLKSSLGSLSDVFHFLGPFLSDAQLALLFASIVLIARILLQHSSQRFRQKETINQMDGDGTTSMERFLKSLRKVLFLTLIKFFRAFQSRPNLPISAFHSLFQQFLGPLISDHNEGRVFTSKCLSLPVSAIRLFCTWGQINRYFPLLNVPLSIDFADSDSICHSIVTSPMALLCDQLFLLCSSATKSTIQMDILRVVCSMLDSHDENTLESAKIAESSAADLITVLPQVPLEMPEMNAIPAAFGVSLVLSNGQLDKILGYLSNFVNTAGGQLGSKVADQMGRIPTIYFDLLSRLSSHIQRPELASMFAHTLLRFVTSKNGLMLKRRPDRAVVVLATLGRLAPHLEDPLDAVARLSPLFSHLEGRQLRWALTQMAFSIKENPCLPSGAKNLIDLLEALESWDLRRIEDPDADRRCEALLRLHDWYEQRNRHVLLEDGAAHTLPLLAHSHVHSMLQNSDISLRGTAANTFRQLIQFVADPPTAAKGNFDVVRMLRSHFIPLILRGLRASVEDETARHEFIQCLASLARCFPNEPQLTSFRLIIGSMAPASAEFVVDPDIDFFECAMHIQLHRRQRAFHRLAERLNSGELLVGHSLLLRFIVPIVQPYLMDTAPNRSALSDQALHLFSSILRRTPWPKYCQMLDHFLRQLDTVEELRTKGAIRVVSAVLNAFHFDLRHLQISDQKKRGEYNGGREVGNDEGNVEGMEEDDEVVERDEQQKESDQRESDGIGKSDEEEKRRIFGVVKGRLLPRLRECLHNWSGANKPGSNWDLEEQKLLRAPLTLAVVKLLEWLPPHVAEQHLHGLVLFLKHLLMSRSASTRQNARKLLEQMVCLLGPAKLPFVLREVKQALNKGYQMHVMVVTVHALIGALEGHLASGDMEPVLREVVDVCRWETFGSNNDKYGTAGGDVDRRSDSHGVPEARASGKRTGHTLTIVGRFVVKLDLLEQYVFAVMRDIANANSRSETVRKLADWLRALNVGLRINAAIGSREQLRWALRLFDENLRLMSADERRLSQMNGESSTAVGRRPANCLLLPPEPKRLGVIQRVAVKSKVHIFVEFALQILVDQLAKLRHLLPNSGEVGGNCDNEEEHDNRDKCEAENKKNDKIFEDKSEASDLQQIVPLLEQFVPLIIEALKQKYDKVIALSLRALLHLFKCPQLFLANERIEKLVDLFFVLLADYSSVGSAEHRSNVLELQQQLFKCFTQVIRNISPTLLNGDRLQLLFNYVETDILDVHKQTTAFNLVKAIIGRKIEDKSLTNIVTYLSELAITSPSANIRSQCRQTVLLYLTVHPRGQRQYERWMDFFLNQCEYELEEGRLSALEMVHSIISEFTEEANARYALLVHLKLCVRLLNDDSVRCRQFVALALRRLLCSVTPSAFNDCLAATNDWLAAKKPQIRLLAWRAFSQFIASECQHFGPTHLRQIVQRACHSFSISTKLFADQSDTTKLALCELFQSIVNKTPKDLIAELFSVQISQKVDQILVKSRHSSKCRRTSVNFDEEISSTNRRQKTTIWPQFFVNLDHCLGRCQRNALNLPLSFAAGAFVAKLTEFTECREEIVKHLSGQGAEDLPLDYSPLCSLCLNLITQIDPKPPGKIVRSKVNVGEAVVEETEEDGENVRQNGGGRWDDELAEQAVRSLATLMPSLSGAHFELTCKKLSKLCWAEAVTESDSARKRLAIFKLIGALAVNIPSVISEQFSHLCSYFISIIYREMSKKSSKYTEELHSLAVEVGCELRRRIGDREFTSRLAKCQRERTERVQRRKSDAKTLFVTDPVAALVDKQRRHERKKEARRRRLDIRKPYRAMKRRRKTANGNTNERNEL